jgi:LPXTG-motif cell wall-anchored protein
MFDWIQNNFFLYVGILVLILIALVAVLFVVRKNQES